MAKKRNGKTRLVGNGPINLTPQDKQKRIDLLRGSIVAGNDNQEMYQDLQQLTNHHHHHHIYTFNDTMVDTNVVTQR